ncbi:MAG: hypothetical protein A3F46_10755 [Legionellales bacterium RIFCSPHIGHO2_12_FULL_42_9]|nr:MAG: hypothetical protein A3F46_10755 [Legionellales bacterium RIFCSPHIGHO2_12_FULL_42_9]
MQVYKKQGGFVNNTLKTFLLIISLTVSFEVFAADVHGISPEDAKKIIKKYGRAVTELESILLKEISKIPDITTHSENDPNSQLESKSEREYQEKRIALTNKIIKENGYLFVDFQTIIYPNQDKNKLYTTIEIIDQQHAERMRFVNKTRPEHALAQNRAHQQDLIEEMIRYNNIGFDLLLNHQISSVAPPCPVYHCVEGFEHPQLKPYLTRFNNGVITNKKLIIETITHDPSPERRAAAAFLIGHFQDPHEIITVLSPHIADQDEGVRNNVMRVIGATMAKTKISNLDLTPFLNALDSPYTTDRNKALYVLFNAADSKKMKRLILQKGGDKLLALMQLQQPNNHEFAYLILQKISGKDFGPTNQLAWGKWVSSAKRQLT